MNKSVILTGVAATAALGFTIAQWLAREAVLAERIEQDDYCQEPAAGPPVVAVPSAAS